jgi:hypothetical protein
MDRRSKARSLIPRPNPIPIIGPIKGDINIAPIITAVEFTFSPSEAIKMAKIRIQRLVPLKIIPLLIVSITEEASSFSLLSLKWSRSLFAIRNQEFVYK